jgi:hypothetical protein
LHDNGQRREDGKMGRRKVPTMEGYKLLAPNKKYFSIVRKLYNKSLNPKINLTNVHVCDEDLMEVFGLNCSYKLINPFIHVDIKCELKKLHWQIYGSTTPTNNDFVLWFMKGYIAQKKGIKINWEKTTTSITRERAQRRNVGRFKSGSIALSYVNGGKATTQLDNKPTPKVKKMVAA